MKEEETSVLHNGPVWKKLGPGLITGAADDDPSGIATYSQVGAGFGYSMLWTAFLTFPLMVGIQIVSARIGRVTGNGLAANIRRALFSMGPPWPRLLACNRKHNQHCCRYRRNGCSAQAPDWWVRRICMGSAFAVVSLVLQVFIPFPRYAPILKLLTLSLFAYVATVFAVEVPWGDVFRSIITPSVSFETDYVVAVVAVFGTTISPYLFFWQASQEVEEQRASKGEKPLKDAPEQARDHLQRIKVDTYIGMGFSNLIAFFIMLTAAVTLHQHGVKDIQTSAQAAEALRPIAGEYAFLLFSAGIVGTGLLAVPVLAGSAAYAVAESFKWRIGLGRKLLEARGFYMILIVATLLGVMLNFTSIDPIKALFWSAVINGVIAVPIMAIMMAMAAKPEIMGNFVVTSRLQILGWLATAVMALAVLMMAATSLG